MGTIGATGYHSAHSPAVNISTDEFLGYGIWHERPPRKDLVAFITEGGTL